MNNYKCFNSFNKNIAYIFINHNKLILFICHFQMIFLPEAFDYIEPDRTTSLYLAESIDGPLISNYKSLAKSLNVWLSLGGFHDKVKILRLYISLFFFINHHF